MGRVPFHPTSRPVRFVTAAAVALAFGGFAGAAQAAGVSGKVLLAEDPVAQATVYAYRVVERTFRARRHGRRRTCSCSSRCPPGSTRSSPTRSGCRRPCSCWRAAPLPSRSSSRSSSRPRRASRDDDFWSTRASVPGDVLRDLDFGSTTLASAVTRSSEPQQRFAGAVTALASRGNLASSAELGHRRHRGRAPRAARRPARRAPGRDRARRTGGRCQGAVDDLGGGRASSFRLGLGRRAGGRARSRAREPGVVRPARKSTRRWSSIASS